MKTTTSPAPPVVALTDEDIRAYAYHLYEQSGCLPGRDLDNWLEAKACMLACIPRGASHTRLHHHLHHRNPCHPQHGFTMPPSDAAIGCEEDVPAPVVKSSGRVRSVRRTGRTPATAKIQSDNVVPVTFENSTSS